MKPCPHPKKRSRCDELEEEIREARDELIRLTNAESFEYSHGDGDYTSQRVMEDGSTLTQTHSHIAHFYAKQQREWRSKLDHAELEYAQLGCDPEPSQSKQASRSGRSASDFGDEETDPGTPTSKKNSSESARYIATPLEHKDDYSGLAAIGMAAIIFSSGGTAVPVGIVAKEAFREAAMFLFGLF